VVETLKVWVFSSLGFEPLSRLAQVADLHRLVKRQMALMEEAAVAQSAAAAVVRAPIKRQQSSGAQDPQTVLVSSLGGSGSGNANASSGDQAAAISDEGIVSRETLRVTALAQRSQQLRRDPAAAPPAIRAVAQRNGRPNRHSLDSNASEQMDLGSVRGVATAGNVTCQQLQEADARLRSASLELSQQGAGGSLSGGSPLAAALGGGCLVRAAMRSLQLQQQQQQAPAQGIMSQPSGWDSLSQLGSDFGLPRQGSGCGDGSAQQERQQQDQQQQAAFAQQSFMAAAGQRHFQDQLMFAAGAQQAASGAPLYCV
jgi:hypothetical protein